MDSPVVQPGPHPLPYERVPQRMPVARFADAGEARLAAAKLESDDVDCDVVEHTPSHGIGARGATLTVEAEQVGRAVEVLSATPARRCLLVTPAMSLKGDDLRSGEPARAGLSGWLRQWWKKSRATPPPATGR